MRDRYYVEKLPSHPRLGRHVRHDPLSYGFPIPPQVAATAPHEVDWEVFTGILDQGEVGACTGFAGDQCIYSAPFVNSAARASLITSPVGRLWPVFTPGADGAYRLYSAATAVDPYSGVWTYPPPGGEDTGSDGLSVARVLKTAGIIAGYEWGFTREQRIGALMRRAVLVGIPWFNSMFDPAADGTVKVDFRSGLAGGHELVVPRYLPAVGTTRARVGFPNSWGRSWGADGWGYLWVDDFHALLDRDGDLVQFTPLDEPAPEPADPAVPPADREAAIDALLSSRMLAWADGKHSRENRWAAGQVRDFAVATGRAPSALSRLGDRAESMISRTVKES